MHKCVHTISIIVHRICKRIIIIPGTPSIEHAFLARRHVSMFVFTHAHSLRSGPPATVSASRPDREPASDDDDEFTFFAAMEVRARLAAEMVIVQTRAHLLKNGKCACVNMHIRSLVGGGGAAVVRSQPYVLRHTRKRPLAFMHCYELGMVTWDCTGHAGTIKHKTATQPAIKHKSAARHRMWRAHERLIQTFTRRHHVPTRHHCVVSQACNISYMYVVAFSRTTLLRSQSIESGFCADCERVRRTLHECVFRKCGRSNTRHSASRRSRRRTRSDQQPRGGAYGPRGGKAHACTIYGMYIYALWFILAHMLKLYTLALYSTARVVGSK